jgi:hypothetical protein
MKEESLTSPMCVCVCHSLLFFYYRRLFVVLLPNLPTFADDLLRIPMSYNNLLSNNPMIMELRLLQVLCTLQLLLLLEKASVLLSNDNIPLKPRRLA